VARGRASALQTALSFALGQESGNTPVTCFMRPTKGRRLGYTRQEPPSETKVPEGITPLVIPIQEDVS